MTSHQINGVRTQVDGQSALRFERVLAHPIQAVWRMVTDPEQHREWLGFTLTDVLEHDPPKLFTARWGESVLRWELEEDSAQGSRTRLVLTHVFGSELERRGPAREAAGWELHLEQLEGALAGEPVGWSLDRWMQLKQAYVRAFPEPGRLRVVDGSPRLTFDRWLEHPPERIWAALTENDQLRQWFAATVEGEWQPGAAITMHSPDGAYESAAGQVSKVEPGRLLEFTWGSERLRFEIWDFGGSCRLLFVDELEPGTEPASARDVASAWHASLDQLSLLLEGRPEPRERMFAAAEEIRPRYDRAGEPIGTPGRSLLRIERVLGHSPARVWQAVSDPELIRQWLDPAEIELEPRVGGSVRVTYRGFDDPPMTGVVRELEPERVLEYEWGEDMLRFELHPYRDRCHLVFTNDLGHIIEAGCATGWNSHFGLLESLLDTGSATPADAPAAGVSSIDGQTILHLERRLDHPVEKVWAMLTEPDGLARWFPTTVEGERRVGARLRFAHPGEEAPADEGVVLAWEPPRVFEFTWSDDGYGLRFELEPEGEGCRLYLTNPFDESREQALRNMSGWDLCLEWLRAALDDHPAPGMDAWKQRYAYYAERR